MGRARLVQQRNPCLSDSAPVVSCKPLRSTGGITPLRGTV